MPPKANQLNWLAQTLPLLQPFAIAWARTHERRILANGRALSEHETRIARAVGVQAPERIRVHVVDDLTLVLNPLLRFFARHAGMLSAGTIGLTLGHGIYIRNDSYSARLLAHECRHVHQYEAAGSIAIFLPRYLRQVVTVGYRDAPYEVDARAHERFAGKVLTKQEAKID